MPDPAEQAGAETSEARKAQRKAQRLAAKEERLLAKDSAKEDAQAERAVRAAYKSAKAAARRAKHAAAEDARAAYDASKSDPTVRAALKAETAANLTASTDETLVRVEAGGEGPTLSYTAVLEALVALSPSKQRIVVEQWPGLIGKTPEGFSVTARSGKELGRFTNKKDPRILEWMREFEAGEVFYDIGANVGGLTFAAAGIHGRNVRIVAIEPSFSNFESLVRNLSRNGMLEYTIPLQVALLDKTGLLPLNYHDSTDAGTSLHTVGVAVDYQGQAFTPAEVQQIPTYRLDDLIETLGLPVPTRVKIDVDGSERALLDGAAQTLSSGAIREIAVEVVDHDGAGTRLSLIARFLGRFDYEYVRAFEHAKDRFVADHLFRLRPSSVSSTPDAPPSNPGRLLGRIRRPPAS